MKYSLPLSVAKVNYVIQNKYSSLGNSIQTKLELGMDILK